MDCTECEDNAGEKSEVKFKDGTLTTVPLCKDCRQ